MKYELWETAAGNLIGTFETEDAALDFVRASVATHGPDYVGTWALGSEDRNGEGEMLAYGPELAQRASVPPRKPAVSA